MYMDITGIAVKLDSQSALSPLASCLTFQIFTHQKWVQHPFQNGTHASTASQSERPLRPHLLLNPCRQCFI